MKMMFVIILVSANHTTTWYSQTDNILCTFETVDWEHFTPPPLKTSSSTIIVNTVLDHQPFPRPKADHEDLSWTEKQRVLWIQGAGRNILVFLLWPSFTYKLKMIWSGLEFLLRFSSRDYFWQRQDKRVISGWPGREVLICITAIVSLNFHPVHFQPAHRSWRLWDLEI